MWNQDFLIRNASVVETTTTKKHFMFFTQYYVKNMWIKKGFFGVWNQFQYKFRRKIHLGKVLKLHEASIFFYRNVQKHTLQRAGLVSKSKVVIRCIVKQWLDVLETFLSSALQPLQQVGCDENVDPGLESGERPLSPKFHLHCDEEVPWTLNLSL